MPAHRVEVVQNFPFSVDKLYAYLSDHEKLGIILPAKIRRIKDGQGSVNGVGSVRKLTLPGGVSLEETVTKAETNRLVEYTITRGGFPVKNHLGIMRFSGDAKSSHLHYTIDFDSALPGSGWLLKLALGSPIKAGLKKLAKQGV
ncbi:polyketide cyclase/dehydrase/lipid transport protein [Paraperlucidibaca baekdonensis]|uniref:Polyketide cyclase/dehydrase/lipid transport protein n=1 Tax=Paraperlucidibaca baekdonensis TaxID=748120 RepID=A0A3E0H9A9_9GAMM|nr:SRPBCC family protein [Paraperlucidibaca baekdonensis]REH40291.1 polyketide cyclase/dehydrase/lipid transport protein [Paraperlucidibaca baekdonensis]